LPWLLPLRLTSLCDLNRRPPVEILLRKSILILPQLVKQVGGIGGSVVLDATISPEGKVTSLKAISGHPMLVQCVMDAVKQWEYKPFMQDRQPPVVTRIEWVFPSPAHTKSEEAALRDYYPAFSEVLRASPCSEVRRSRDQMLRRSEIS